MAQLTVAAGVTLHDPISVLEGDTRTPGWAGGLAKGGIARNVANTTFAPAAGTIDLYAGYKASIPGSRVVGAGVSLPRSADNLTLSGLEPYTGYHAGVTNPARTAAVPAGSSRTVNGITVRNPLDVTYVQPPPLQVNLGAVNARLQRFQRNGAQAVFYKDQGQTNVRTTVARWGAQEWVQLGEAPSTNARSATAGADLATQVLGAGSNAQVRVGKQGVDVAVVLPLGAPGARVRQAHAALDLLALTNLGASGVRRTGAAPVTPGDLLHVFDIKVSPTASSRSIAVLQVLVSGTYDLFPLASDPYVFYEFDSDISTATTYNYTTGDVGSQYPPDGDPPVYLPAGTFVLVVGDDSDVLPHWQEVTGTRDGYAVALASVSPERFGAQLRLPPANDDLRSFIVMPDLTGDLVFSDVAATLRLALGEPDLAMAGNEKGSVWFQWDPSYDGIGRVTAPGTAVEAFTGPAPAGLVVGVGGYRGAYVPGTTYQPGDTVLFADGKLYTTPVVTTHSPDDVDVADSPAWGSLTVPQVEGWQTLTLPRRVTLPAGGYYFMDLNNDNMDYATGTLGVVGAALGDFDRHFSYGDTTPWNSSSSYGSTFVLHDSVTGDDVAGLLAGRNTSPFGIADLYEHFVLTADVTFDQIKVYSTGYYSGSAATIGIATSPGATPGAADFLTLVSDPNPWVLAPDTNPLTYSALTPVGGGVGAAEFPVRPSELYYLRAYAVGEQSDAVPLHWSVAPPTLAVSVTQPTLQVPGYLVTSVMGGTPGETIQFTLDGSSTVVATAVVDSDGLVQAFSIPVEGLTDGAHLLVATGQTSGIVGNTSFAVTTDAEYLPPDPDDPAPPVIPPLPPQRWRLYDPTDQTYWDMPINPGRADSTLLPRTLTPAATVAIFGQPIVFEGGRRARRWTFSGTLLSLDDVDILRGWMRPYRIYVSDDLGRVYIVKIVTVRTTPVRDTDHPEHHSFEVQALLYGRVT